MFVRRLLPLLLPVVLAVACGSPTPGGTAQPVTAAATTTESAAAETTTESTEPTESAADEVDVVVGPVGWGDLTLGMDAATARATELFLEAPDPEAGSCVGWTTPEYLPVEVVMSADRGLMAIFVKEQRELVHTPEGIGPGATAQQVHEAYPAFAVTDVDTPNGVVIQVPDHPAAAYRLQFGESDELTTFTLEQADQSCYA